MSAPKILQPYQFPTGHEHGGQRVRLRQEYEERCTVCGHRVADRVTGTPPIETRYLGPRRWANEIPRRRRATRAGR